MAVKQNWLMIDQAMASIYTRDAGSSYAIAWQCSTHAFGSTINYASWYLEQPKLCSLGINQT